jgi:hypothetical protein
MFVVADVRRDDLDEPWKIENLRRSLAMLTPGSSGLSRDDAMLVLELLAEQMSASSASAGATADGRTP